MNDPWLKRWNDRFREKEYAYGTEPNEFLKAQLQQLNPGSILFGAEGEGRNAVYAATLGWKVCAFDISIEGKKKALALAADKGVSIEYQVGHLPDLNFQEEPFDVVALIYAHFPPSVRPKYHQILDRKTKKGGLVIFEAFGKNHLHYRKKNPKIGGPPNLDLLFSTDEIQSDFKDYQVLELAEKEIELSEGLYHNGKGSAIRFVGRKL